MKRAERFAGMVLGLMVAAGWGAGVPVAAAKEAQPPAKPLEAVGTLSAVNSLDGFVTLEVASSESPSFREFAVTPETDILKAGVHLAPADLQPGAERVTIEYEAAESGRPTARTITFEKPAGLSHASGTVDRIDSLKGELFVKPGGLFSLGHGNAFTFDERSVVSQNGERSYLTNLMPGDRVAIDYTMAGGHALVYAVTATTPEKSLWSTIREPFIARPKAAEEIPAQTPSKP